MLIGYVGDTGDAGPTGLAEPTAVQAPDASETVRLLDWLTPPHNLAPLEFLVHRGSPGIHLDRWAHEVMHSLILDLLI